MRPPDKRADADGADLAPTSAAPDELRRSAGVLGLRGREPVGLRDGLREPYPRIRAAAPGSRRGAVSSEEADQGRNRIALPEYYVSIYHYLPLP